MNNKAYNMDCMDALREMPDKCFDLAVVDPPYGPGAQAAPPGKNPYWNRFGERFDRYRMPDGREMGGEIRKKIIAWDVAPGKEYFDQLFRVSRNQVIWGGNYFPLPPARCFFIWEKTNIPEKFTMAMCEYAWTSFNMNAKIFRRPSAGIQDRFHPTQKPVALYKWIYQHCAKPGDKILDTHLGSGSSRIAAYDMGFDFTGYEIDKDYFDKQEDRFRVHTVQTNMFIDFNL